MNITGMNLAVVKTIMNHVDRLQDRIETLEGQTQGCPPDVKRDPQYETPQKKTKTDPAIPALDAEQAHHDNPELARYEQLKSELQKLYGGRAQEYDPTAGGHMFPPHGMCMSEVTLKMIDSMQEQTKKIEKDMERLEQELKKHPYQPVSPHPMIILQPGNPVDINRGHMARSIETRNQLIRDIAKQEGERRILQEGIDFWSTVKPASVEYTQHVQRMFVEKKQLRSRLWEMHGLLPSVW